MEFYKNFILYFIEKKLFLFIVIFAYANAFKNSNFFVPDNLKEDANLLTQQLIKKYNYPIEVHHVTTEDGYILEIHRIVKHNAEPYLLIHGLLDSSATFIIMGPNQGLGYFLWDKGYDVWMGNCRGNRYSLKHIRLNPDYPEFWNFSWHEMGLYDLPAMIDYILHETKYDKLHYIGHSQGTTIFYVMCSKRPEYNGKIMLMHSLGPVVYLTECPAYFIMSYFLKSKLSSNSFHEFLPRFPVADSPLFTNPIFRKISLQFFFFSIGYNPNEYNETMFPVIHSHMPAGSSIKQFRHYFQLMHSKNFEEYNYGTKCNHEYYNSSKPPKYDLSRIKSPIILYFAKNDTLNKPKNVHRLYQELPNVLGLYQIDENEFNHMDFVWGINARPLVYEKIFKIVQDLKSGKLRYVVE